MSESGDRRRSFGDSVVEASPVAKLRYSGRNVALAWLERRKDDYLSRNPLVAYWVL